MEHLFLFGSPLGMFILMREHESLVKRGHRSSASLVPTEICKRIHNIYHPSDPEVSERSELMNPVPNFAILYEKKRAQFTISRSSNVCSMALDKVLEMKRSKCRHFCESLIHGICSIVP